MCAPPAQAASFAEFNGLKAGSLSMKAEANCLFQAVSKQTAVKVSGLHLPLPDRRWPIQWQLILRTVHWHSPCASLFCQRGVP